MFDPVTDEVLRLRRMGPPRPPVATVEVQRTSLVCHVCAREIRPEEQFFWVDMAPHCFQCHGMLEFELHKEREAESRVREHGTKWKRDEGSG